MFRSALNLPKDVHGAVIAEIDADSPAGKAGLREGDVIQEVNKQPVKNAKDLVAISKKLKATKRFCCASIARGAAATSRWKPGSGRRRLGCHADMRPACRRLVGRTGETPRLPRHSEMPVFQSQISRSTLAFQPPSYFSTEKP